MPSTREALLSVALIFIAAIAAIGVAEMARAVTLDAVSESLDALDDAIKGHWTEITMIAWTHTTADGAVLTIEVYRRDYESTDAWLAEVRDLQELYPPDSGG